MKGKMATFLMAANILFCLFIADGLVCGCFVDLVNYLFDGRPDLVVLHNLLGGISKENSLGVA